MIERFYNKTYLKKLKEYLNSRDIIFKEKKSYFTGVGRSKSNTTEKIKYRIFTISVPHLGLTINCSRNDLVEVIILGKVTFLDINPITGSMSVSPLSRDVDLPSGSKVDLSSLDEETINFIEDIRRIKLNAFDFILKC